VQAALIVDKEPRKFTALERGLASAYGFGGIPRATGGAELINFLAEQKLVEDLREQGITINLSNRDDYVDNFKHKAANQKAWAKRIKAARDTEINRVAKRLLKGREKYDRTLDGVDLDTMDKLIAEGRI